MMWSLPNTLEESRESGSMTLSIAVLALVAGTAFLTTYATMESRAQLADLEFLLRSSFTGSSTQDLQPHRQARGHLLFQGPESSQIVDETQITELQGSILHRRVVSAGPVSVVLPRVASSRQGAAVTVGFLLLLYLLTRFSLSRVIRSIRRRVCPLNWSLVPDRVLSRYEVSVRRCFYAAVLILIVPVSLVVWRSFAGTRVGSVTFGSTMPTLVEFVAFIVVLLPAAGAATRAAAWLSATHRWSLSTRSRMRVCGKCEYPTGLSRSNVCSECGTPVSINNARIKYGVVVPIVMLGVSLLLPAVLAAFVSMNRESDTFPRSAVGAVQRVLMRSPSSSQAAVVTLNFAAVVEMESREHRAIVLAVPCRSVHGNVEQFGVTPPARQMYREVYWAVARQRSSSVPEDSDAWHVELHGPSEYNSASVPVLEDFRVGDDSVSGSAQAILGYLSPASAANYRPVAQMWLNRADALTILRHTDAGSWNEELVSEMREALHGLCAND